MKREVSEERRSEVGFYRCEVDGFTGDLDAAMRHLIEQHQGRWTIVSADGSD